MAKKPDDLGIEHWGWYSIGINAILIGINLVIAVASGSLAVAAELIHNAVDFVAAVGVLAGLKLSKHKSKSFPYGLYKLENVVSVIIAGMIFLTAYEIGRGAFTGTVRVTTVNVWMIIGVAFAGAIPLVFSRFEMRAGRAANSPAIIADAQEYRVHGLTAGVAMLALIGSLLGVRLDRIAALVIVVAIVKTGLELFSDGMRVLLDASLSPDTLERVRDIMLAEPAVADVGWLTGRNAGRFRFIEAEITLRINDLGKAEAITQRIERAIRKAVPQVERVLLHAEPQQRTHMRFAAPLEDASGTLSKHFGEAPFFGFVTVRLLDGVLEERQVLANPYLAVEKAKGIKVAEWLVVQKCDVVLVKEILQGKGPPYVFADAGVEMRQVDSATLGEALIDARPGVAEISSTG